MKVLLSLLLLTLASSSFAEDMRYYDVEIVIIENLDYDSKNAENWPLDVNLTLPEKRVQLGEPVISDWLPKNVDAASSYKLLDAKSYQLSNYVEKISESKSQRVIFHTAWRQPGLDKDLALPVYFKREIPDEPAIDNNTHQTGGGEESVTHFLKPNPTSHILEGILRVTLARYLRLEAELTYRNKIPPLSESDNPFTLLNSENDRNEILKQGVIHLKQDRNRIRSNELHYLDHPVLGMLVNITPYLKPEEAEANITR